MVTSKDPNDFTNNDLKDYQKLIILTNTAYRNNDPTQNYPKSGNSKKWNNIIKPIWKALQKQKDKEEYKEFEEPDKDEEEYKEFEEPDEDKDPKPKKTNGKGLKILPSDPNALIDRFDLLFSSQKAGHTGVRNEIVAILDELKRQRVINVQDYKKLNHLIKK